MRISEYILCLESVKDQIGDVEVQTDGFSGRQIANSPEVGHTLILRGRESKPRFWSKWDGDDRRGEPVCIV